MREGRTQRKSLIRLLIVLCASLITLALLNCVSAVVVYNALQGRTERPDYSVFPGVYTYERAENLPRREFDFYSGENLLKGYYSEAELPLGLVVTVHGRGSGADDLLPLTAALFEAGYSVIAFDCTGVYSSEGDSLVGMCQPLLDLLSLLEYIESSPELSRLPLYLLGYSLGGYAAASALALCDNVRAAALIAPVNSAPSLMVEKASEYVGGVAYLNEWIFDLYQRILFGDKVELDGVGGINSSDTRVLVAQGLSDTTVSHKLSSIYAYKDSITNPTVTYYLPEGELGTHTGILLSSAAHEYRSELSRELEKAESQRGRALTYEEQKEFYSSVDHELYSEVNPELLSMILDIYDEK